MDRTVCAFIPRFELAIRARGEPGLWERPVAVAELAKGSPRVHSATPLAEQRGILPGLPTSQARALCPELEIWAPNPQSVVQVDREILTSLAELSPLLDSDAHGAFFLSLEGMGALVHSERDFARKVQGTLRKQGFQSAVAVAEKPFVAWVMARKAKSIVTIPAGTEADSLSQISVGELGFPEPALDLLRLLGVRTAGALAHLPPGALSRRLGPEGTRIERLCRGELITAWPSSTKVPVSAEEVSLDLDVATEELEPLLFLIKSLVDRLVSTVAQSRRALSELTLVARLDNGKDIQHRLIPSEPNLDVKNFMDLIRLWLDSKPFSDPVARIRIIASRTAVAHTRQLSLLKQKEQEEDAALQRVTARLASAFGVEAVVRPRLSDTYRPEARLRWVPFQSEDSAEKPRQVFSGPPPMMLKLVWPPEPVHWEQGVFLRRPGKQTQQVIHFEGPHRLSGDWWEEPFDRSYFWLACAGGELLWVYRNESDHAHYLMAMAD